MDNLNNNTRKLSKHEMELKNTLEGVRAFAKIKNIEALDEEKTITGARGRIEKVAEIKKSKDPEENQKKRYNAAVKLQYNKKKKEWNTKIVGRKEVLEKQLALLKELEEKGTLSEDEKVNVSELRGLIEAEVQKRNEKAAAKIKTQEENSEKERQLREEKEGEFAKQEEIARKEREERERKEAEAKLTSIMSAIKNKKEIEEKQKWNKLKEELLKIANVEGIPKKDKDELMYLAWDIGVSLTKNDIENLQNQYQNKTAKDLLPEAYRKMMAEDFINDGSKEYSAEEIAKLYVEREKEARAIRELPKYSDIKVRAEDFIEKKRISLDYRFYKKMMIKSYYGDKDAAKKYDEAIRRLTSKENKETVTREYKDPITGEVKTISYERIKPYEDMKKDMMLTQLEEYPTRLERYNAYKAGDRTVYSLDEKRRNLDVADEDYIKTYNQKYNSRKTTYESLKTLGNYGKKVAYTKLENGETFKNLFRGTGNALKFIRNHTTAPINKFIGSKIVAPLYKRNAIKNDKWEYPDPFEDRATHRYEKRKEYFRDKGNNFITSRINAILRYKEGNEAILAARASELMESIVTREANEARLEAEKTKLAEYYKELREYKIDIDRKSRDSKFKSNREIYENNFVAAKTEMTKVGKYVQELVKMPTDTDIIDFDSIDAGTHKARNNKNVTRIITGFKIIAKAGVKFVGEKLSDWMIDNATEEVEHAAVTETIPGHYDIEEYQVLKYNGQDKNIEDFLLNKNGQTVEVYSSTYPGATSVSYQISDRTIIRGIKTDIYGTDSSISDVAGNGYTEAYTPMVKNGFIEAIKQTTDKEGLNLSQEDIGNMITEGAQGDVYLAVSNRSTGIPVGWIKVSKDELKEYFSDTLEPTTMTRQGDWIPERTEIVEEAWTETVVNERVVSAINGSKKMMDRISKIHDAYMVYENARDLEDKRVGIEIEKVNSGVEIEAKERRMKKTENRRKRRMPELNKYHFVENDELLDGHVEEKGFNYNPRTKRFEGSEREL